MGISLGLIVGSSEGGAVGCIEGSTFGTLEGARSLLSAVGLDPNDPSQPGDQGIASVFGALARLGEPGDLETLAELAVEMGAVDDDPVEAVAILRLLGALEINEDGELFVEPLLAASALRVGLASTDV